MDVTGIEALDPAPLAYLVMLEGGYDDPIFTGRRTREEAEEELQRAWADLLTDGVANGTSSSLSIVTLKADLTVEVEWIRTLHPDGTTSSPTSFEN